MRYMMHRGLSLQQTGRGCGSLAVAVAVAVAVALAVAVAVPSASELSVSGGTAYAQVGVPCRPNAQICEKMKHELIRGYHFFREHELIW